MITFVIADDEPLARYKLRRLLDDVEWAEIVAECADGPSALNAIDTLRPAVVLLDVHMPGLSGLEVLRRARHSPVVVFTTAWDRYAVTAFELSAVDYLLKPFGRRRFDAMLERLRTRLADRADGPVVERAASALDGDTRVDPLFVREGSTIVPVPLDDVIRFEAQDDYVMVHTRNRRFLASVRMRDLGRHLDPTRFLRVHRSHVINLDHVDTFESHTSGRLRIRMRDGTELFASRSRSRDLRQRVL